MHDEEAVVAVLAVLLIFGMPLAWLVMHYCHATAKVFFDTRLKRDMVARGFSAQEIAHVVHGNPLKGDAFQAHGIPPAKPVPQPKLQPN